MSRIITSIAILCFFSCAQPATDEVVETTVIQPAQISLVRDNPKKEPVARYSHKLPNDLNDWWFKVELLETSDRFRYLLRTNYEEIYAEDTIQLPNLNIEPTPVLKKGGKDLECILGFMDNKETFREYISVAVVNDQLKVKTLKHYAVRETQTTQEK